MRRPVLGARRLMLGAALAGLGLPALVAGLVSIRADLALATPVLLVLLLVVAVALVGGLWVAVPAAALSAVLLNYYFAPPLHRFAVDRAQDLVVLAVFLAVAVAVSAVVDLSERRRAEAARNQAEAQALSSVAGATLSAQETLPLVLEQVRSAFGAHQVSLVDEAGETIAQVGLLHANDVEEVVRSGAVRLVVRGPQLFAADRRVLKAFADAAATASQGRKLAEQADAAAEVDRLRTALLAAVGHDLRTPLAGVKAAVTSLRSRDVVWSAEETAELLLTIDESADRLESLLANLLAASRLEAGALSLSWEHVGLDEVVARTVLTHPGRDRIRVEVPESLPVVRTDPGLLERVLANLIDNALRHDDGVIVVRGAPGVIEVVDHGPGLSDQVAAFEPFQRLGDRSPGGVGLGLAVARGFMESMGGRLVPARTDGGGLTMRVELV